MVFGNGDYVSRPLVVLKADKIARTLLTIIGLAGFLLQFLITEGLQREKAGRATNLIVCAPFRVRFP